MRLPILIASTLLAACPMPPTHPAGYEYCDAASRRIIELHCLDESHARITNACKMALDDHRDWHPKQISTSQSCNEIEQLVNGAK